MNRHDLTALTLSFGRKKNTKRKRISNVCIGYPLSKLSRQKGKEECFLHRSQVQLAVATTCGTEMKCHGQSILLPRQSTPREGIYPP